MNRFIKSLTDNEILSNPDTLSKYSFPDALKVWKDAFLKASDQNAPIKTMKLKERSNPWFDYECLDSIYARDFLHRKATQSKKHCNKLHANVNESNCKKDDIRKPIHKHDFQGKSNYKDCKSWKDYAKKRNEVNSLIESKKRQFYVERINKSKSSKETWDVLKTLLPNKTKSNPIPKEMSADKFNQYFATIGEKLSKNPDPNNLPWKNPPCEHKFSFHEIQDETIFKYLRNLPQHSKLDLQGFDTKLLRIAAPYIHKSLTVIYNMSLKSGIMPDEWKIAKVTPIFKGEPKNMTNRTTDQFPS